MKKKYVFFLIAFYLLIGYKAFPQQNRFFLDTKCHFGTITDMAVHESVGRIATSGTDNTIRIYNAENGNIEKVLYLPVSDIFNYKIKINAILFDASGQFVYCAGNIGAIDAKNYKMYVFNIATGQKVAEIDNIPDQVFKVSSFNSGAILVLSLFNGTLLIYNDGELLIQDKPDVIGGFVDFDNAGNLYALSYNSKLSVYKAPSYKKEGTNTLSTQIKASIFSVAPNGRHFSYSGSGLKELIKEYTYSGKAANYRSYKNSCINEFLYTDAYYTSNGSYFVANISVVDFIGAQYGAGVPHIQIWDKANANKPAFLINAVPKHFFIKGIREFGHDKVVYFDSYSNWGVVKFNNTNYYTVESDAIVFEGQKDIFKVSYDGSMVGFGMNRYGDLPITFSVKMGVLEPSTFLKEFRLIPSMISKLKSASSNLQMLPGEKFNSLTLTQDNKWLLVGSSHRVICLNLNGQERWVTDINSPVNAINASGDGRFCITASEDGIVRWYNMVTGSEQLSLYLNANDNNKWILWTPDGKYKSSATGEEYAAWIGTDDKGNAVLNKSTVLKQQMKAPIYIDNIFSK